MKSDNLGAIHDLMIDKPPGKVAYAIMSFGGFLGMGNQYHPVPWPVLKYDTSLGGYVVDLDKQQLEGTPAYDVDAKPARGDRAYESEIHDYYGVGPYWNSIVATFSEPAPAGFSLPDGNKKAGSAADEAPRAAIFRFVLLGQRRAIVLAPDCSLLLLDCPSPSCFDHETSCWAADRISRPSESVREHHEGLHSFRSMRRIEARRRKASALWLRHSQSLASRRQRPSQANVRSTIQRFGSTTKPVA